MMESRSESENLSQENMENTEMNDPLFRALYVDDHLKLQTLLKGLNVVEYRHQKDETLLHLVARAQNACFMKYLIQAGCDLNATDDEGNVPLLSAIKYNDIGDRPEVVKLLVQAGSRVDVKNSMNENALNLCFYSDDDFDDLTTAKVLLDAGASVNVQDRFKEVPLHNVAMSLRTESIDLLLNYGADVNIQNDDKDTALHKAAQSGGSMDDIRLRQLCVLQSLLNKGADVNIENRKRQTPFHFLLESGNKEAIELFIEHGADLSKEDYKGRGPLFYAAVNPDTSVLKLLLDKGCNVEDKDFFNRTALYRAVKREYIQNISFLCNNGYADINNKDVQGKTPLYTLIEYNKKHDFMWSNSGIELLVDLLIDLGADVNAVTWNNQMLLDIVENFATEESKYFVIKLFAKLVFFGIEVDFLQIEYIKNDEDKFREYYEKCSSELSTIQNFTFYGTTPILPIFRGNKKVIASYVKNQNLKSAFDAINCNELFPIYGKGIKKRFDKERTKYQLRVDAFDILSNSLPSEINTAVIVQEIIKYLDDKELVRFMRPFGKYYIDIKTQECICT